MNLFGPIHGLLWLISLGLWGLMLFALVDSLIRPTAAYPAAGKRTKLLWTLVIGVTFAVSLALRSPLGLFGLAGVVAALVYIVDVRPAVRAVGRGGSSSRDTSGSW
jgi:hypothetical protein